jgi:hypothetical protein
MKFILIAAALGIGVFLGAYKFLKHAPRLLSWLEINR